MARRRCELGAVLDLPGAVVPEPVLVGFKALNDTMPGLLGVSGGVLVERIIAASNMAAGGASPQMEPPRTGLVALDASVSGRRDFSVDHFCHFRSIRVDRLT